MLLNCYHATKYIPSVLTIVPPPNSLSLSLSLWCITFCSVITCLKIKPLLLLLLFGCFWLFCCCLGGGSSHGHKQLDFEVIMINRASGSGPVSKLQTVPLNTTYAKMIKQFNILNCYCVAVFLLFFFFFLGGGGVVLVVVVVMGGGG